MVISCLEDSEDYNPIMVNKTHYVLVDGKHQQRIVSVNTDHNFILRHKMDGSSFILDQHKEIVLEKISGEITLIGFNGKIIYVD